MRKRPTGRKTVPGSESYFGFFICVVFFACGAVIGTFAAEYIADDVFSDLCSDISASLALIKEGSFRQPGWLATVWSTCKYHIFVVFLGFSLLGPICIPAVSGVKGFFLSFSFAAVIKAINGGGWLVAFGLFGLSSLVSLPCFFILSMGAFKISLALCRSVLGTSKSGLSVLYGGRKTLSHLCVCLLALVAAVLIELYVVPYFFSLVSVFL